METHEAREALVKLLQMAYSGERAAYEAYEGHKISVLWWGEFADIEEIQSEELQHIYSVSDMLDEMGEAIDTRRESRMEFIGMLVGIACRIGAWLPFGWFLAMYGAGKLEASNVLEYEHAAKYASFCGYDRFVPELMEMAETERRHEKYFREKVESHFLSSVIPIWRRPEG